MAPALDALGLDLVVSGGTASIFAADHTRRAPVNVQFPVGFVSDDDLAALFAQAMCFAFPSRTEGFGIPLLEAMVHGAPIISSDCASMPEVCGDAALYASARRSGRLARGRSPASRTTRACARRLRAKGKLALYALLLARRAPAPTSSWRWRCRHVPPTSPAGAGAQFDRRPRVVARHLGARA